METANQRRSLPIFSICDTEFYVDINGGEFIEVRNPTNRISMSEIRETAEVFTELTFDRNTKNIYEGFVEPHDIPDHVQLVLIPPLKELDPVGLAQKLGLPDQTYLKGKKVDLQKVVGTNKKHGKHKRGHGL